MTYKSYKALGEAIEAGDLHLADATRALAAYLDEIIAPGRDIINDR